MRPYYILVDEWLYPTESGRDVHEITYDSREEALENAEDICASEVYNFENSTHLDCNHPTKYMKTDGEIGYLIDCKNGLDDWYFAVRVIEMEPLEKLPV